MRVRAGNPAIKVRADQPAHASRPQYPADQSRAEYPVHEVRAEKPRERSRLPRASCALGNGAFDFASHFDLHHHHPHLALASVRPLSADMASFDDDTIPPQLEFIAGPGSLQDPITVPQYNKDVRRWEEAAGQLSTFREMCVVWLGMALDRLRDQHRELAFTPAVARALWPLFKAELVH